MKKNRLYKLLYKSFEMEITSDEKKILEQGREIYPELNKAKDEITEIRLDVKNFGKADFSSDFESGLFQRVNPIFLMREVHGRIPDAFTTAFKEVSLTGAIVLTLLLFYNLNAGNNNIIKNFLGISKTTIEYASFDPSGQQIWTDSK